MSEFSEIQFLRVHAHRPSQASHFVHQAKSLFEDPSRLAQGLAFLSDRTQLRADAVQVWDFPDGSAVQLNEEGQLIVAQAAPNFMDRCFHTVATLLFKRPISP